MKQKFVDVFGKISMPDPKAWWVEYKKEFKEHPVKRSFILFLKTLVVLYFFMQLYPFLIDLPYLVVFLFVALPFIIFEKIRANAEKYPVLSLILVTLLYFFVAKPIVLPQHPNALLFNEKFFKFENYKYVHDAVDVIPQILHIGTPKEKVDKILIEYGGARSGRGNKKNRIIYLYTSRSSPTNCWDWDVVITYDKTNKINKINVRSTAWCGL